jgi:hypothetical protein
VVDVLFVIVVGVFVCNRVFIPDEKLVWCPEKLLTAVLAHVHYLPDSWRGQAHTNRVREEFSQLFHYKAVSAAAVNPPPPPLDVATLCEFWPAQQFSSMLFCLLSPILNLIFSWIRSEFTFPS